MMLIQSVRIIAAMIIAVAISLSAVGCSKDQLLESMFETAKQYDCDRSHFEGDARTHRERCDPQALGGQRETYREYKDKRAVELADGEAATGSNNTSSAPATVLEQN